MEKLPSNIKGPSLHEFPEDLADAQFVKLLSPEDDSSSDEIPHARFNFFSLEDIRPFVPTMEHLLDDVVVREQLDPFFAECRAFGRLVDEKKDDKLAVRCHGYTYISEDVERRIGKKFHIYDWNRSPEDKRKKKRLRAIVKNHIRFVSFGRPKKLSTMRENLVQLNKMGVYNMDICKRNYLGGRLFDFSIAITTPHISFWTELRTRKQIKEDMDYDLACFDSIAEAEEIEKNRIAKEREERWEIVKRRSDRKTVLKGIIK
ncbi:kinetochore Sim4 complex subunit FTA2-domain-containing protein [Annulohypoxylon stygium]|nr:kinetochore Sim4 complex subunit FTA2-domain-containing protein [Annulohypoxylon stygium]